MRNEDLKLIAGYILGITGAMFLIIGGVLCFAFNESDMLSAGMPRHFTYIFPAIGALIFGISMWLLISGIIDKKVIKDLRTNGDVVQAKLVEAILDTTVIINNEHPYIIKCEWTNPEDGKKYIFKSENLWQDPKDIIYEMGIKSFTVYVDRKNMKRYVMDIDNVKARLNS